MLVYVKCECLSCRCMFVSYMHHVAVLNSVLCRTGSLLKLVEDARGDHIEEAYSRAGLMTLGVLSWVVQCCFV